MLHTIKTKVARFVGKQIGECKIAYDEGYQLGLTIATSKQVNNDVEEPTSDTIESNQYAYDKATQNSL